MRAIESHLVVPGLCFTVEENRHLLPERVEDRDDTVDAFGKAYRIVVDGLNGFGNSGKSKARRQRYRLGRAGNCRRTLIRIAGSPRNVNLLENSSGPFVLRVDERLSSRPIRIAHQIGKQRAEKVMVTAPSRWPRRCHACNRAGARLFEQVDWNGRWGS